MTQADWDFYGAPAHLTPTTYISAPSSLEPIPDAYPLFSRLLLKTSVIPNLKLREGCIDTFFQAQYISSPETDAIYWYFRWQNGSYYYLFYIGSRYDGRHYLVLRNSEEGTFKLYESWGNTFPADQGWHRLKLTWFNSPKGLGVCVEKIVGEVFTKLFPVCYDSLNKWKDIGGRVGFDLCNYVYQTSKLDNTLIYSLTK